mgnify:CR=1 FL=1
MSSIHGLVLMVATSSPPPPPRQSATQLRVMRSWSTRAAAASAAATPTLHALLAPGGKVRGVLAECCPSLASLSAAELAARLRLEIASAEMTHNFAHFNAPSSWENDVSLPTLANASYFYNLNELAFLGLANNRSAGIPAGAETALMGFPPFTGGSTTSPSPATFDEASQRPVYALLNLLALDGADAFFGDVGFIFRNSWVRNATLFFPTDTGNFEAYNSTPPPRPRGHCSYPVSLDIDAAWPSRVPGIAGHLDHILVALEQLYSGANRCEEAGFASPLANILKRLFGRGGPVATPLSSHESFLFIEADIAASPSFNVATPAAGYSAVKHVVASFRLVGTEWGDQLRELATRLRVPLLWALGTLGADGGNASRAVTSPSVRLVDAVVCSAPRVEMNWNFSGRCASSTAGGAALAALWSTARAVNDSARTPAMLREWWSELARKSAGLLVDGPLRPLKCEDEDACFGSVACSAGVGSGAASECCACVDAKGREIGA